MSQRERPAAAGGAADALGGAADLAVLATRAAQAHPDRPAVVEVGGRTLTWAELDREVGRVAAGLGRLGVVAPQRVLLCLRNRVELVTCYLGTLRAQAVAVPVNPSASVADLRRMIADSGARIVVADAHTAAAVRPAVADHERPPHVVVVGEPATAHETTYDALVAGEGRGGVTPALPDPEKLAALLYTAGSSGVPRAAMLTHRALLANLAQVARIRPPMITAGDTVLCVLPLFHVYALCGVLGGVLAAGATMVLGDGFAAAGTLDLIAETSCTVVPVAPPAIGYWLALEDQEPGRLRRGFEGVRLVLSGSATVPEMAQRRFEAASGHRVHQGYGLTEAAPVVSSTLVPAEADEGTPSRESVPGSLGRPIPGVEIRVVDAGAPAEPEDPGELQVRGQNLFSGYWPDGLDGPGADGWWPTGDIGLIGRDGTLTLVDRVGDTVVVSGFTVYPREVEATLLEVPGVTAAAVIGAEADGGPDERGGPEGHGGSEAEGGQVLVAYVVAPGLPDAADVVRRHAEARLAGFKRPARIEVVSALPTTGAGGVEKGRLRQLERRRALGLVE